jgi:hypothetical protein
LWIRCCGAKWILPYVIFAYYLYFTAAAAWVIYGYAIYFSAVNDCQKYYDTSVALVFMCIFLFFGLFFILVAVFLWCVLPCLYFCWIKPLIERA